MKPQFPGEHGVVDISSSTEQQPISTSITGTVEQLSEKIGELIGKTETRMSDLCSQIVQHREEFVAIYKQNKQLAEVLSDHVAQTSAAIVSHQAQIDKLKNKNTWLTAVVVALTITVFTHILGHYIL